ncbi:MULTISPECIES: DNA sulfur modification protein DndD [Brevibacillus]|uniref:DNA sulfur modification protein DndD n=1 Tax=Brevibacillus TaxID=55080 RepID=UPI000EEB0FEE|nr:DNA sulfur modification protein DndD [Brevibacillus sp.]HBZ83219.1 DNA sulfur modification protein DndD [Brevibacillus sp.]
MKFNRLRLTNIGAFYGNFDFDLRTFHTNQNVVLFGGKNGAGKTTILESIRLALFGPLAYGYKTENAPYFEKISSKLNSYAVKNRENKYQVILDLELVENLQRNVYVLRRSWQLERDTIKEDLEIICNQRILSSQEKDIFQTKLREETPPQLLELCLFDGEKVAQAVSDEVLSSYLQETAKVMFNLDLFENLETDLKTYLKQDAIQENLSSDQQKILELENTLQTLQEQRARIMQEQVEIETKIEENQSSLENSEKQFEIHGGLLKEQRDSLINQMNDIEQERRAMMDKNRELISTLLPFALVKDILHDVNRQMENETKLEIIEGLKQMTQVSDFEHIIQNLTQKEFILAQKETAAVSEALYTEFLGLLSMESSEPIHRASYQQKAEIVSITNQINQFDPEEISNNIQKNAELIKTVQEIRQKINENDVTSELRDLLESINEAKNQNIALQHRKEQLNISRSDLEEQIQEVSNTYLKLKEKLVHSRKAENIFAITKRVLDVSKEFRRLQMQKKLQDVEIEAARMLQLLFRKELFVVRVFIHPETFQLKLFNSTNEEINKENLSAGEKQLLLLSTIWAMAHCSRRRLPFVFDTLLGRLDQTHKKSIIEHLIPRCGDQVIILATDSEIDEEHYKIIRPAVVSTFTIEYNTQKSSVDVSKHFFTFSNALEDNSHAISS